MTKTSKRKLIVTSALVLGAVATVGATFGTLILNGGTKEAQLGSDDGINIDTVQVQNKVVNLEATVLEGKLNLDGYETEGEETSGKYVTADEPNDTEFTISLKVTGDPEAWTSVTITLEFDGGHPNAKNYFDLSASAVTILKSQMAKTPETNGSETIYTKEVTVDLKWAPTYQNGIVNYINTDPSIKDLSAAEAALNNFQTALNGATLTANIAVVTA